MLQIIKCNNETFHELTLDTLEKGAWINLINPTEEEIEAVHKVTNVPLDFLRAALDEEERSRTEIEKDCMLVLTNIPIMRGKDEYDTLPLGFILIPNNIITVCLENNQILAEFNYDNAKTFSTVKRTRFLFQVLYKSATYYLKYLKQINRRTDEIESHLRRSMKNSEIFQLLELQKGLTYFTASLRSNGIVMEKLMRLRSTSHLQHLIPMYEEDEDLLEDAIIENKQAIEMVEMYSHILNGMLETFASIISNNLNIVMKFLACMTIILAIPTAIASVWGMNVALPFQSSPHGFIYIMAISAVITALSAIGLWKKGMF